MLILKFFLERLQLHVLHALRRTHKGSGTDEAGQLVDSEQHLFHLMLRGDVGSGQAVAVAGSRADDAFVNVVRAHELLRFNAMLFRIELKVQVMQKADVAPIFLLVAIA